MQKAALKIVIFYENAIRIIFLYKHSEGEIFMVALIFIAVLFKLFVTKSDQDFNLCYKTKQIKTFHLARTVLSKN